MPTKRKTVDAEKPELRDELVEVTSLRRWRQWLAKHHGRDGSVWVVTWKAAHADLHVPMSDLVDEAICWGWIDSVPRSLDGDRSMRRMSPRRAGSAWSRVNKARAEALIAATRMQPSGYAVIERAKADGSWTALDLVETLAVPADLKRELLAHPPAMQNFEAFPRSSKRAILEWIEGAKKQETRAARIRETAEMASRNLRANHARQVKSAGSSAGR